MKAEKAEKKKGRPEEKKKKKPRKKGKDIRRGPAAAARGKRRGLKTTMTK